MMRLLTIFCLATLAVNIAAAAPPFRNGFFAEAQYPSKGHFYLQEHNGRYLFVTPDGEGFYPIGINHLNSVVGPQASVQGDVNVKEAVIRNMADWGFNCGGYGTFPKAMGEDVYYVGNLNVVHHGFYRMNAAKFPDVFDDGFEVATEKVFKRAASAYYDPKRLIGMVWSDLPSWNIFKSRMLRRTDWVTEIRNMGSGAPGKKAYVKFLRERYDGKVDLLKKYYKLSDKNLEGLEDFDFSKLYIGHPMIMEDDQLFMAEIAERYYQVGSRLHNKYFPNTLLLGDRFLLGDHPDAVLRVASKYVDAISLQVGDGYGEAMPPSFPFPKETFDHIHNVTKKPVLIADHQISFYTDDYKATTFSQAGDERQAAWETEKFLIAAFSEKYICGYFRCTYLSKDEPHGRGVKQGLVGFDQKPYPSITDSYRSANWKIREFVR